MLNLNFCQSNQSNHTDHTDDETTSQHDDPFQQQDTCISVNSSTHNDLQSHTTYYHNEGHDLLQEFNNSLHCLQSNSNGYGVMVAKNPHQKMQNKKLYSLSTSSSNAIQVKSTPISSKENTSVFPLKSYNNSIQSIQSIQSTDKVFTAKKSYSNSNKFQNDQQKIKTSNDLEDEQTLESFFQNQTFDDGFSPEGYDWLMFNWDPKKTSPQKLQLENDNKTVTVIDPRGFKSTYGQQAMRSGSKYYFQVKLLVGTLFKIGISRGCIDHQSAFSDTDHGWALFDGQLRHGSNNSGTKYGKRLEANSIVGVMLDMVRGTLSYTINGKYMGIAFKDQKLTEGEFYPAVSTFYKNDSFMAYEPLPED